MIGHMRLLIVFVSLIFVVGCKNEGNPEVFRECLNCPQMHKIKIQRGVEIMVSKYETTNGEWQKCHLSGECEKDIEDESLDLPVTSITRSDISDYINWINSQTSGGYRLPTDREWEIAARGGTYSNYWWGHSADRRYANYGTEKYGGPYASGDDQWLEAAPVGSFPPNPFGLHDMNGNVSEYVTGCPVIKSRDGQRENCEYQITRGGNFINAAKLLENSFRLNFPKDVIPASPQLGFRLVKDLER